MSNSGTVLSVGSQIKRIDILLFLSIILNFAAAITLRVFGSQMYPFFIIVYVWIAAYTLFLTLLLRRERIAERPVLSGRKLILAVIILILSIRLVFLGQTEVISLDSQWYLDFGKFIQMGEVPYSEFYFPYPPVFAYFIAGIMNLYPSIDSFRILATILDVFVAFMIFKIVRRYVGERWASTAVLSYALLPISVIESGWNGHFEPLVNLFLLIAVWFLLEKKYCLSGIAFGLAAATKIYPLFLFPILLFYVTGWNNKVKLTISTIISILATYLPIVIFSWLKDPIAFSEVTLSQSASNPIVLFFESNYIPDYPIFILSSFVCIIGVIGLLIMLRPLLKHESKVSASSYYSITIILGVIIITLGIIASIYPLLPVSRTFYWRYPIDVGIVRGVTSIGVGCLVIISVLKGYSKVKEKQMSLNSFLVMGSATLLLLLTVSRSVFYGWYLLWSIPIFLLMKDRRLGWIVLLGLLLIYPSYTHDNFESLGFEETRQWSDELDSVEGWSSFVNVSRSGLNSSMISTNVTSVSGSAVFRFDTSNIHNKTLLKNLSIIFTKTVNIEFVEMTDFVARIISSWDPAFGRYAEMSLTLVGVDQNDQSFSETIINRPGLFTNLTYVIWRFSFSTIVTPELSNVTVHTLQLTIFPLESAQSFYAIDYFYTTYAGTLNPLYFVMIPSLISLTLVSYILLDSELRWHKQYYE